MIYHAKLRNLLTANKSVYEKLLHDNPSDLQKSHLRKLLAQIQRDIEKLIREKNYKILRRKKSLHRAKWVNNSNEQKPSSNRVIRGKNSVRFFIRRDRIDRKLLQSVLSNDHLIDDERLLMISKLAKANEHDAINNDDDCKQEQKNEETLADQDSDHSSSLEDQSSTQQSCSHDRKDCDVGQIGKMMLDKEDFIKMLQLVHKNDLEKMANCKKPRKRRTTANPQFSHAAIEAKRITKMEIANERRHRRRIALEKHHNKPCEPTNLNDLLKSMNVFKQTNEMFPGLFCITTDLSMEQNRCKLCSEICHFIHDTIVICESCLSMFHVICLEGKHFMMNGGYSDLDRIRCCTCHPSSTSCNIAMSNLDKSENLTIKLAQIRREVFRSSDANHCLQHILQIKQWKREKLTADLNELRQLNDRMVDLSTKLNNVNYHNDNHNDDNNNDEDEDEITDIQNHHQSANEQEESNVRMLSSRCDRIDFIDGIPIHHHRDHSNIDESNGEEYCKLSFCT